jgi:hypothetical protein
MQPLIYTLSLLSINLYYLHRNKLLNITLLNIQECLYQNQSMQSFFSIAQPILDTLIQLNQSLEYFHHIIL